MPNAKRVPQLTDEQEARIQVGIAADSDNPEITAAQFATMRPAAEVLPAALYAALTRPRGRPKALETKVPVKLRLDRAAVEAFKASGPGWQTRMNNVIIGAAKKLRPDVLKVGVKQKSSIPGEYQPAAKKRRVAVAVTKKRAAPATRAKA